jgi:hypothetical protein
LNVTAAISRASRSLAVLDGTKYRPPLVALALGVGQVLVGRVGAGELGAAAHRGHVPGGQRGRLHRHLDRGAVDVPVEGALEVLGLVGLGRVQRNREDLPAAQRHDRAQPAAERELRLVVGVQAADEQHAAPLQRLQAPADRRVVEPAVDAGDRHAQVRAQRPGLDHGNCPFRV